MIDFEIAIRLKDAGFPQPDPATGQFWYTNAGLLCWIARKELGDTFILCDTMGSAFRTIYVEFGKDLLFAPTAIDILNHFPGLKVAASEMKDDNWRWQLWKPNFTLAFVGDDPDTMMAEYWLFKNESKKPIEVQG